MRAFECKSYRKEKTSVCEAGICFFCDANEKASCESRTRSAKCGLSSVKVIAKKNQAKKEGAEKCGDNRLLRT